MEFVTEFVTVAASAETAGKYMRDLHASLSPEDTRFRHAVHVLHDNGASYFLPNAFLVTWRDPNVRPGDWTEGARNGGPLWGDNDGLWVFVFTRTQFLLFPAVELSHFTQYLEADESVRLTLDMSADLHAELERLAKEMGISKAEVLRKGIALLDVAVQAQKEGKFLGICDGDVLKSKIAGITTQLG